MKSLVFCACVLIIGSSSSTDSKEQIKNALNLRNDIFTCFTENRLTEGEFYNAEEIMNNVHTESGNEDRTKKIGCFIACTLKKQNLMEGSNIKEEEVPAKLDIIFNGSTNQMHRVARKCMEEARSITQECEKGFSIYACTLRGTHEARQHEEHEKKVEEEGAVIEQTE